MLPVLSTEPGSRPPWLGRREQGSAAAESSPRGFGFSKTADRLPCLPQAGSRGERGAGAEGDLCLARRADVQQADLQRQPPMDRGKSPAENIHSLPAICYPSCFSSFAVTRQEGAVACALPLQGFHACSPALSFPCFFPPCCILTVIWKQNAWVIWTF